MDGLVRDSRGWPPQEPESRIRVSDTPLRRQDDDGPSDDRGWGFVPALRDHRPCVGDKNHRSDGQGFPLPRRHVHGDGGRVCLGELVPGGRTPLRCPHCSLRGGILVWVDACQYVAAAFSSAGKRKRSRVNTGHRWAGPGRTTVIARFRLGSAPFSGCSVAARPTIALPVPAPSAPGSVKPVSLSEIEPPS